MYILLSNNQIESVCYTQVYGRHNIFGYLQNSNLFCLAISKKSPLLNDTSLTENLQDLASSRVLFVLKLLLYIDVQHRPIWVTLTAICSLVLELLHNVPT